MGADATTHTPGPWLVEPIPAEAYTDPDLQIDGGDQYWVVDTRVSEVICTVGKVLHGAAAQNAQLIAAAPELLAAVKGLLDAPGSDDLRLAAEAVRRAEGESDDATLDEVAW